MKLTTEITSASRSDEERLPGLEEKEHEKGDEEGGEQEFQGLEDDGIEQGAGQRCHRRPCSFFPLAGAVPPSSFQRRTGPQHSKEVKPRAQDEQDSDPCRHKARPRVLGGPHLQLEGEEQIKKGKCKKGKGHDLLIAGAAVHADSTPPDKSGQ